MTPAPKNRIMIFGPKDDGSYVVEFKTAEGGALATAQRGARDPALPGADALRIVVPEMPTS